MDLGNIRVGGSGSQAITISNTDISPAGYQEGLNASVGALGGQATASGGPITNLAAGSSSSAISVGLNGIVAGIGNSGTVQVALASNGTISGLTDLALSAQTVNVSATGYRLANGVLNAPTSFTVAARVGDAVSAGNAVSVTNSSPDIYTEGLKVTIGTISGNAQAAGNIANLAAQGTDAGSIKVGLGNTSTAGSSSGTVGLDFISTGAGTTGASDLQVGSGSVTVNGKVYTPAIGALTSPTTIDFGTVRVGTAVAAQDVTILNAAVVTALNDTLKGTLNVTGAGFSGNGMSVTGLGAQQSNGAGTLAVGFDTSSAGVRTGTGQVAFLSQNPDMADLLLAPSGSILLEGTVNALANPVFAKGNGAGSLSGGGTSYTLDFGNLLLGSGVSMGELTLANLIGGPADDLLGSFSLAGLGSFTGSGFGPVNLAANVVLGGLDLSFDANALGLFTGSFVFSAFSHNAFQTDWALDDITVLITANVIAQGGVPEPSILVLFVTAGGAMLVAGRRRRR